MFLKKFSFWTHLDNQSQFSINVGPAACATVDNATFASSTGAYNSASCSLASLSAGRYNVTLAAQDSAVGWGAALFVPGVPSAAFSGLCHVLCSAHRSHAVHCHCASRGLVPFHAALRQQWRTDSDDSWRGLSRRQLQRKRGGAPGRRLCRNCLHPELTHLRCWACSVSSSWCGPVWRHPWTAPACLSQFWWQRCVGHCSPIVPQLAVHDAR